ncbi:MAG: anion transporter [Kiritimatiellia bacterium]|jgi:Na+/H+ antiporter NhaD/arsenite permease-like protein
METIWQIITAHPVALLIFLTTYTGVALGGIPGLALDRTGVALLGAIAMAAAGCVTIPAALGMVDAGTIILLYALMVLSAQFRLAGSYTRLAISLRRFMGSPSGFLLLVMVSTALLSAILVNDVICLALTPVLTVLLLQSGLNPVPYLLGLAVASNIGSAATIIGNPQNMLLGQTGQLDFGAFLVWCGPPSCLSLLAAYGWIWLAYRGRLRRAGTAAAALSANTDWQPFDAHQNRKALIISTTLIVLFFTPIPRELTALTAAGLLLCSRRMHTREMLALVDWHLITLFCGLFIVTGVLARTGLPMALVQAIADRGINPQNPYLLTGLTAVLSNIVSNVPAVMLLVQFLQPENTAAWYIMALASTYAGNLVTIGSIANLITIEQAGLYGVKISFGEHARIGVPVTIISLLILVGWIAMRV